MVVSSVVNIALIGKGLDSVLSCFLWGIRMPGFSPPLQWQHASLQMVGRLERLFETPTRALGHVSNNYPLYRECILIGLLSVVAEQWPALQTTT